MRQARREVKPRAQLNHHKVVKAVKPLLNPTHALYQGLQLSNWFEDFWARKPEPLVDATLLDIFSDKNGNAKIFIRADLVRNQFALELRNSGRITVPFCDAVLIIAKYGTVYLCDESGKLDDFGQPIKLWYRIDPNSQDKIIRPLSPDFVVNYEKAFAEAGEISENNMYEFDGYFNDLIVALQKEGFRLVA